VKRFLVGLLAGGASSGITWWFSQHAILTAIVGLVVALLIWIRGITRAVGDFLEGLVEAFD
jgi:hypothetical protein